MGNLTSFADLFIRIIVFGLPISLFYFLIKYKKSRIKFFFVLVLLVFSISGAIYFFISLEDRQELAIKKFIGPYKLEALDKKDCNNCKLYLHPNMKYDIIQNEQIIGRGDWEIKFDSESGSYYLHIENGPNYMIMPNNRTITYINRIKE